MDERASVQIKKTSLLASVCRKDTGHREGDDFSNSLMKTNYNRYEKCVRIFTLSTAKQPAIEKPGERYVRKEL